MEWLSIVTFIISAITSLEPIIQQIIKEIEALIAAGQPVPAALSNQLYSMQRQQQEAYAQYSSLPPLVMQQHKALLAQLKKTP
jgi:hypothetical protein